MDIGKRIREIRKANGQKLLNISQQTGLSQPYISEIERGVKAPSVDTLEKICTALGVTLAEFFADTQEQEPIPPEVRRITEKLKQLPVDKLKILESVLDTWIDGD
ncbi:MAG: helix-turn-helix domain-containing protein [Bacillota bacterium]